MTSGGYLATLLDILRRRSDRPVGCRALAHDLASLLSATGHRTRGSDGRAWDELADVPDPHAADARLFATIAEADDPLAAARLAPSLIRQRIFGRLDGWWRPQHRRAAFRHLPADLREVAWDDLPPRTRSRSAKDGIRAAIRDLASYERGQARPGHPFKGDQEAALRGLADIFNDLTGSDAHPLDLPHSPRSVFIRFARAALHPYLAATEGSADALSNRWRRAKEQARSTPA
ncbi:hypothetical protein [Thalassobaculum sp.]|uniref:hypothetical protein n=1 Tax=Thalassobaculum sp. TaxID=2022740 RepID=UPI0032F01FAF